MKLEENELNKYIDGVKNPSEAKLPESYHSTV